MGAPDAVVDTFVGPVELELKIWRAERGRLVTKVRPVQRRYHMLATLAARRSGFLVGLDLSGDGTGAIEETLGRTLVDAAPADGLVLVVFSSKHMPPGLRWMAWEPKLRVVESFRDIDLWAEKEWGVGSR